MQDFSLPVLQDQAEQPFIVKPFRRRLSRQVMVGSVPVGGNAPISVETMTKTKTGDVAATVAQVNRCEEAGVDIVRITINDWDAAEAIGEIVNKMRIPIVSTFTSTTFCASCYRGRRGKSEN